MGRTPYSNNIFVKDVLYVFYINTAIMNYQRYRCEIQGFANDDQEIDYVNNLHQPCELTINVYEEVPRLRDYELIGDTAHCVGGEPSDAN